MNSLAASIRAMTSVVLVLLALIVPTALAQVPQPSVTVTVEPTTLDLEAANTTTFNGTVAFNDQLPTSTGNIDLTIDVPEGWTATAAPSSFSLTPGQQATFVVTLTAPAAAQGAQQGPFALTATSIADQAGRSATQTVTVPLTRVDPAPPAIVPWYQTPVGIVTIFGIVILAFIVAGVVIQNDKKKRDAAEAAAAAAAKAAFLDRETGITIALAGEPVQYGHKREIVYRLEIKNTSDRPRVAHADVLETTNGWRAALQFNKIPLSPAQTQQLTLVVTPDAVITPGDRAHVVIRARPEEAQELFEKVGIDVVAPKHGVPADPHYRIVTVHREGANIGVNR